MVRPGAMPAAGSVMVLTCATGATLGCSVAVAADWSLTPLMVPATGSSVLSSAWMSSIHRLSARLVQFSETLCGLPSASNTWTLVGGSGVDGLMGAFDGRLPTNSISSVGVGSSMTCEIWIGDTTDCVGNAGFRIDFPAVQIVVAVVDQVAVAIDLEVAGARVVAQRIERRVGRGLVAGAAHHEEAVAGDGEVGVVLGLGDVALDAVGEDTARRSRRRANAGSGSKP